VTLASGNFSVSNTVSGQGFTITQTSGTFASAGPGGEIAVTAGLSAADFDALNASSLLGNYTFAGSASGTGTIVAPPPSPPAPAPTPPAPAPVPTNPEAPDAGTTMATVVDPRQENAEGPADDSSDPFVDERGDNLLVIGEEEFLGSVEMAPRGSIVAGEFFLRSSGGIQADALGDPGESDGAFVRSESIAEVEVRTAGRPIVVEVDADTFLHANPDEPVSFRVQTRLENGEVVEGLPEWLSFEAPTRAGESGRFSGVAPDEDATRRMILVVTAIDTEGNESRTEIPLVLFPQ